jgi:hypothetical protein
MQPKTKVERDTWMPDIMCSAWTTIPKEVTNHLTDSFSRVIPPLVAAVEPLMNAWGDKAEMTTIQL